MLTQEELKRQLSYDPETGVFTWAIRKMRVTLGKVAGKKKKNGYREIRINLVSYQEHRLAWLFVHGEWPKNVVDHINRDPSDNRIENLREATFSQNLRNVGARSNSSTGVKGVSVHSLSGKYRACIRVGGKKIHLGLFVTIAEAGEAYRKAAEKEYGAFAHTA